MKGLLNWPLDYSLAKNFRLSTRSATQKIAKKFNIEDLNVKLRGTQGGKLDASKVTSLKESMQDGTFDFSSKEGKIGVSIDKSGTVHIGEGHHRVGAAVEIFEEPGDVGPLEKLLNNARQTFVDSPPSNSTTLPRR